MSMRESAKKRIAVILSGCGYLDGTEIREAVAILWALDKHGAEAHCFAPDEDQFEVVDHLTGKTVLGDKRNMLRESARIARGEIKPLSELRVDEFAAIVMPGGFGAAKNLSSFARQGASGSVQPNLLKILRSALEEHKPIGAVCISPAVLAIAFKDVGLSLTVGQEGTESAEIGKLGHHHFVKNVNDALLDSAHHIVTSPAYMYDKAPLHEVFEGVELLVLKVLELTER
jgi:enhancing lycopene biosynthesis protein 2